MSQSLIFVSVTRLTIFVLLSLRSLVGEAKCKSKFWRCISKVVKGGLHYVDAPGGLSGAFQKTMFRMAFHGGFGNVWNALMTIPEVRN